MCVAAELIEFEGYITSKIKTLKLRFEKVETKFKCIKTKKKKNTKKWAICDFGEEIQSQNLGFCNIDEVITHTQKHTSFS